MKRNWLIYNNIGSVKGGTGWYLVVLDQPNLVLGQNNLVPIGIKWNWVSTRLLCLYILKKVEIWSDVTIAGRTNERRTRKDRATQPMQWTMDGLDEQFLFDILISKSKSQNTPTYNRVCIDLATFPLPNQ